MWDLISGGIPYNLDDLETFASVGRYDGLGMAPVESFMEQGPQQDGASMRKRRLKPRTIGLELGMEVVDSADYWNRRELLMTVFYPMDAMQLRVTKPNGDVRQIDVYTDTLPIPAEDRNGTLIKTWATMIAPDPSWYNPEAVTLSFGVGAGSAGFVVPMVVPTSVGTSTVNQTITVNYDGTWKTYPHSIRIYGPITDCVITNNTTGEKLDFTGVTIDEGDYYEIDCRYQYKTVKDSTGTDKISELSGDSDLAEFHIAPHPEAPQGLNALQVVGTSANQVTEVLLTFYERFIGV